jgi:hypothetical protein
VFRLVRENTPRTVLITGHRGETEEIVLGLLKGGPAASAGGLRERRRATGSVQASVERLTGPQEQSRWRGAVDLTSSARDEEAPGREHAAYLHPPCGLRPARIDGS